MLLPSDCLTICANSEGVTFGIRQSVVDDLEENGPIWKFESLKLIPGVLEKPLKVYGGLGRDGCYHAECYCGSPTTCYADDGRVEPAPEKCFFVVYLETLSGGKKRVWDWGWRKEDPESPGNPVGHESFTRGEIWPKT